MEFKIEKKYCGGIYKIVNNLNEKIYIGKSKNFIKRYYQYTKNFKDKSPRGINSYMLHSMEKHGFDNFRMELVEYLEADEITFKERELYWMQYYDSTNPKKGYNLRMDSATRMLVHEKTSKKISKRLKVEWANGIRKDHNKKLKTAWENNPEWRDSQAEVMRKALTKYIYKLSDLDNNFIELVNYRELKEKKLQNVVADFAKKNSNIVKFKGYIIERILNN